MMRGDFSLKAFVVVALAYDLAWCAIVWKRAGTDAACGLASIALAGFIVGRHLKLSRLESELEKARDDYQRRAIEVDRSLRESNDGT